MEIDYKIKAELIFKGNGKDSKIHLEMLYECDPSKNTECQKRGCYIHGGECRHTHKIECARQFGPCE